MFDKINPDYKSYVYDLILLQIIIKQIKHLLFEMRIYYIKS